MQCVWIKWWRKTYMNTQDYNVIWHLSARHLSVCCYFLYQVISWTTKSHVHHSWHDVLCSAWKWYLCTIHFTSMLSWHVTSLFIMCHISWYGDKKWDIFLLSIYLHNSESFYSMCIFSSHCITIFIYSVH